MPFWKKEHKGEEAHNGSEHKEKINYKARLEHKQYLAQESPEPVYDIAECGLKNVPSGVFCKCKILRKEALLLQNNELSLLSGGGNLSDMSSVLQVLDLHANNLDKLPEEIGTLKQLKVLHVHHNKLKHLPDSLGRLSSLQTLNVSHNCLKDLPSTLGEGLQRLRNMDARANAKLRKLDRSLAKARSIQNLKLDPQGFQFPPAEIVAKGTEEIMRFLCKESDIDYISPNDFVPPPIEGEKNGNSANHDVDPYDRIVRGSLKMLDKQKETKMKEMLAMQRDLEENQAKELALAANVQNNKMKLLTDLAAEEAKREEAVKKVQQMKEKEKESLMNSLHSAENRTDALIDELMESRSHNSDPKRVLEELEKERKEMEELFAIKAGEEEKLREQEILREMQRLMAEEMRREQVRSQYEEGKRDIVTSALNIDLENDRAVGQVLAAKGKQQSELISNLLEDEKYQREAFSALFLKQDVRHKEISQQVEHIQNELASLTMVEMTKKDLKLEFEREAMAEKRETLTKLLLELMVQRADRAKELQARLKELEQQRQAETDNYWLIQYQKLLDSKPKGLVEAEDKIDPAIKDVLTSVGAEDFMPVFALKNITLKQLSYMKDKELSEMGVHNTYLRQKILSCAEESAKAQERLSMEMTGGAGVRNATPSAPTEPAPSAPPGEPSAAATGGKNVEDFRPSAPPTAGAGAATLVETYQSTECVICMENKCDIIFLPCGHVCVCFKCETSVSACPLCRANITQKVRLH